MRSTGWPDPAAVLVRDRKVRIAPTQLHAYYVTWFEGKKQNWENVGSDALTAWQCKLNREAIMNGAPREPGFPQIASLSHPTCSGFTATNKRLTRTFLVTPSRSNGSAKELSQ
jgi:hypothetical protein